jgi:predicted dithiol-disulfide oxidoreductase (DUF899 family)
LHIRKSHPETNGLRKKLLTKEKELTRHRDAVNAERRRLSMVKIDKEYVFDGTDGQASLLELFDGRRQLIVYHFMFEPGPPPPGESGEPYDEGCSGCSFVVDNIGHLSHLHARDTSLVLVSRAPLAKIVPFKTRMGPCRGIRRSGAISTTTSTSRRTKPSPPSSTTWLRQP